MDDMTHWALRSPEVRTPNLDRLRVRGTTFTHAFNQGSMTAAVCMPARQMLISGLSLFAAADHFMAVPHLGQTLGDCGYNSYFTGKWHNEIEALQGDYRSVGPWAGGMLPSTEVGKDAYYRPSAQNTWDPTDQTRGGHWMTLPDGRIQHSSERWTDAAVEFIDTAPDSEPFFLHIAYHAPHDPRQSPAEFLDLYDEDEIAVPPNFLQRHPFDNGELAVRDELLAPMPRTPHSVRFHRREYFAILSHADQQIGRILDALDAAGVTDNTVVVFSGDHGLALGEHGLFGKQNSYDHSIRVPLVIAGPGVCAAAVTNELVYSGSIYPTICELVGIPVPEHIEFPSLVPAIHSEHAESSFIFGAYKDLQRLIRTRQHKLVEYADPRHNQLFDLDSDPWELTNLYHHHELGELRDSLRVRLLDERRRLGDRVAEGREND